MNRALKNDASAPRFVRGAVWLSILILLPAIAGLIWPVKSPSTQFTQPARAIQSYQPEPAASGIPAVRAVSDASTGNTNDVAPEPGSLTDQVRAIAAEKNLHRRQHLVAELVNHIPTADVAGALPTLREEAGGREIARQLLRRWAETDLHSAAQWASRLPPGSSPEDNAWQADVLRTVALVWVDASPEEAINWASQLPETTGKNAALLAMANESVRTDPMEALKLAANLAADGPRDQLIQRAALEWALQDPLAARDWARQIADAGLRNQVLSAVATNWSVSDPAAGAGLAIQELSGQAQENAVIAIVQRWGKAQPDAATAWVRQFPEGSLRQAAIQNLASLGIALK